jgi:hypothetical protein
MTSAIPATDSSGDNENGLVVRLREFGNSKLPEWEKEARDEILKIERVEEWKKDLKQLREALEGANKLTSGSAFVRSVKEFEMDISKRLDQTGEAILDYIDFVSIGRPPKDDVHGNAVFIRERRIFQREILDKVRLLGTCLIALKFPLT